MANEEAWNEGWEMGAGAIAERRERKQRMQDAEIESKARQYGSDLAALQKKLGTYPKGSPEYDLTFSALQSRIHDVHELFSPDKDPTALSRLGHHLTDALRLTNPTKRIESAAGKREAQTASEEREARAEAAAAPAPAPDAFAQFSANYQRATGKPPTPEIAQQWALREGGIPQAKPVLKEYSQIGNAGVRAWLDATQPIPPGWTATGGTKNPIKGTLVRSAQSSTGFAQTWVDPANPGQIVGWQPVTPSRFYQGTQTSGFSVDPLGVRTTSTRTTQPLNQANVDLSEAIQFPATQGEGAPVPPGGPAPEQPEAPPPSAPAAAAPRAAAPPRAAAAAKPKSLAELRRQAAARAPQRAPEYQLDAQGHIPATGGNEGLRQAANQLLDGADIEKLPLPARDKQAAAALASRYGWGGQGLFTPKEKLLVRESKNYLAQALDDPSLKVLDSAASRAKLANMLQEHKGVISSSVAAMWHVNAQEQAFLRMYNQLAGTISGLGQLTRGGRVTEATINRLMRELPNPEQTHSSADAKQRLKRLLSEIDVAVNEGQGITASGQGSPAAEFLRKFRAGETNATPR